MSYNPIIGFTVKQLRELIKDIPDTDAHGNEYMVWVEGNKLPEGEMVLVQDIVRINENDLLVQAIPLNK